MNNLKTIITFNDHNIGITLFNNEENNNTIYYQNKIKLSYGIIRNGFIYDMAWVYTQLSNLIHDANSFTKNDITNISVSIAANEILIRQFEINDINLPNGIFNSVEWELLKKSININQGASKYIYDIDYESWTIDNHIYTEVSNQIIGTKLDIKARMFQINKVLYQQYVNLFERLCIKIDSMKPIINDVVNITDSVKKDHAELFVILDENNLCLVQTNGRKIERCVSSNELSIKTLYSLLASEMNMSEKDIINIIHQIWVYFGDLNNIQIVSNLITNFAEQQIADSKKFNNIVSNYIKSLVEFVECNAKYLIENKKIIIKKISYVPITRFTMRLFNLISIYSKFNLTITMNNPLQDEYGSEFMQDWLLMNTINKNINKPQINSDITKKIIKQTESVKQR